MAGKSEKMPDDRLPTALWVEGHLRNLDRQAVPYYIVNKGAYASGTVLLKIVAPGQGCIVLQQQRDKDGVLGWMGLFKGEKVAEGQADDHIRRSIRRDPDLWAIEIEDRSLQNPFEGKIF